jgi:hypothetical protein
MSTTLLPPTYYVVKPSRRKPLLFPTVAQAAVAIITLVPTSVRVSVMIGIRTRTLTDAELRELGQQMRAYRRRKVAVAS